MICSTLDFFPWQRYSVSRPFEVYFLTHLEPFLFVLLVAFPPWQKRLGYRRECYYDKSSILIMEALDKQLKIKLAITNLNDISISRLPFLIYKEHAKISMTLRFTNPVENNESSKRHSKLLSLIFILKSLINSGILRTSYKPSYPLFHSEVGSLEEIYELSQTVFCLPPTAGQSTHRKKSSLAQQTQKTTN